MYVTTLSILAPNEILPKYPSVKNRFFLMLYWYSEIPSVIKGNALLMHTTTWLNLKILCWLKAGLCRACKVWFNLYEVLGQGEINLWWKKIRMLAVPGGL